MARERVKIKDVRARVAHLNALLEEAGVNRMVEVAGRYGYWAVDVFDRQYNMIECYQTGLPLRQADMIIRALIAGFRLGQAE